MPAFLGGTSAGIAAHDEEGDERQQAIVEREVDCEHGPLGTEDRGEQADHYGD
jgi:hypothetical protein